METESEVIVLACNRVSDALHRLMRYDRIYNTRPEIEEIVDKLAEIQNTMLDMIIEDENKKKAKLRGVTNL